MEFGSAILADLWGYETTRDAEVFEQKRQALAAKFERVEAALGDGPFFAGERFSLVDAVFAPIFRYFDVFDEIARLAHLRRDAEGARLAPGAGGTAQRARRRGARVSAAPARLPGEARGASADTRRPQ